MSALNSIKVDSQRTVTIAEQKGVWDKSTKLGDAAILVLNEEVMEPLVRLCSLKDISWLPPEIHPYAASKLVKKGMYKDIEVSVVVPPMGASPFSCIVEDLVTSGVKAIFLVCPAWSLGKPVEFGDLIIPRYSVGIDGTSLHYNNTKGYVVGNEEVLDIMIEVCVKRDIKFHVGGNATCEALYRISSDMISEFKGNGCFSMENGETNTLFAMANELKFITGVLFQPYIDLTQGWFPDKLDDNFANTCKKQAYVILDTIEELRNRGKI